MTVGTDAVEGGTGSFSYRTELDPVKLAEALRGPSGPVVRSLLELGERVKQIAVTLVGVSKPDPVQYLRTTPPRRPGTLRDSIVKRVSNEGDTVKVSVGSEVPYARWHHEGTKGGTIIRPVVKQWLLYAGRDGQPVYRKQVVRGSTPANPFLTRAVEQARNG